MHTAQGIGHAIGSRACRHIVGMKGTASAAAGSYGEVLLPCFISFLLICTGYRMLETGRIGGVSSDRNVYVLFPHDGYAFRNAVCAVAVYLSAKTLRVRDALDFLYGIGIRIILSLHKGEAVDPGNNLSCVLAQAV